MNNWDTLRNLLTGLECIEIGAPTPAFMSTSREFPMCNLYDVVDSLDAINIFEDNPFQTDDQLVDRFKFDIGKYIGKRYNMDGSSEELLTIPKKYDCLITSHVIEHIANPIKAIHIWKQIIKKGGYIFIIAPEKSVCHDRGRNYTSMTHLIEDYETGVDGADMSHVDEILKCGAQQYPTEEYKKLISNNKVTNVIHHHCFSSELLQSVGEYCGLETVLCFNYDRFTFQNVYLGKV